MAREKGENERRVERESLAVTSRSFWEMLKEADVHLPENISEITVSAKASGVVDITYKCFADDETVNAITGVIAAHDQENIIGLTEFPTPKPSDASIFRSRALMNAGTDTTWCLRITRST